MDQYEPIYSALKQQMRKYFSHEISAGDLKHDSASLGIYPQRNELLMMRIRINGGQLSLEKLKAIAQMMETFTLNFAHITSRQDLQLHDVSSLAVYPILKKLTAAGMPFRGGGGNTLRNILVSSDSGVSPTEEFDVFPYAEHVENQLFKYPKAFELPRKLKIGFSNGPDDSIKAIMQDLGFIAKIKNNKKGFEVYVGGGMGKESIPGLKISDFITVRQVVKCVRAVTDLFYDHGDRTNRNKARLRFVVKRLGKQKFKKLFREYFYKKDIRRKLREYPEISEEIKELREFSSKTPKDEHYQNWLKFAVSKTKFGADIRTLRLFVPYGNLQEEQMNKIIELAEKCGVKSLRLTQNQDLLFPIIHQSALPIVFDFCQKELADLDLTLQSFKGHLTSCVGANVCKIGIADSPGLSDVLAEKLDEYFTENPKQKAGAVLPILRNLKISGCPNACSGHVVSKLGLQGMKKKRGDTFQEGASVFIGGFACGNDAALAEMDQKFVPKENLGNFVEYLILEK